MVAKYKKIMILVNFGHFWSFGAPVGSPRGSSSLILEVHLFLLENIVKVIPIPGYWLNPLLRLLRKQGELSTNMAP